MSSIISYSECLPDTLGKTFAAKSPATTPLERGTLVSLLGEREGHTWIDKTNPENHYSWIGTVESYNADAKEYTIVKEGGAFVAGIENIRVATALFLDIDGSATIDRTKTGIHIGKATGVLAGTPPTNADLKSPLSTVSHADYGRADEVLRANLMNELEQLETNVNNSIQTVTELAQDGKARAIAANDNANTRLLKTDFNSFRNTLNATLTSLSQTDNRHTEQLDQLTARIAELEDTALGEITISAVVDSGYRKVTVAGTTTDIPNENDITFNVIDREGNIVSSTVDIANNSYNAVINIPNLAPGTITIKATARDRHKYKDTGGNIVTATINEVFEDVRGKVAIAAITVDQGFRKVSGNGTSTDCPNGTVTVEFTDSANKKLSATGTVTNNVWSFADADIRSLAFGKIDVKVSIVDKFNFPVHSSVERDFRLYTGSTSVTPAHDINKGPVLDVHGGTTEVSAGTTVNVTAWNITNPSKKVSGQTTVRADGNWSLQDLNVLTLGYGNLRVKAQLVDRFGNAIERVGSTTFNYSELPINIAASRGSNPHKLKSTVVKDDDLGAYTVELLNHAGVVLETVNKSASQLIHEFDLLDHGPGNYRVRVKVTDPYNRVIVKTANYTYIRPPELTISNKSVDQGARRISFRYAGAYVPNGAKIRVRVTNAAVASWVNSKTIVPPAGATPVGDVSIAAHPSAPGRHTVRVAVTDANNVPLMSEVAYDVDLVDVAGAVQDLIINHSDLTKKTRIVAKVLNKRASANMTLTLRASNGATVTKTAGAGFSADGSPKDFDFGELSIASLPYGTVTAKVVMTDRYGSAKTRSESYTFKNLEGGFPTATFTINSGSSRANFGGTVNNVAPGSTITVILRAASGERVQTTTTVQSNGTWAVSNVNIGSLPHTTITATASGVDLAGRTVNVSRTAIFQAPGLINCDTTVSNANKTIHVLGQVQRVPLGNVVNIVVRDSANKTVTSTTRLRSDGTLVDKHLSIASLAYGTITTTISVVDNNGTTISDYDSVTFAPVNGSLAVTAATVNQRGMVTVSGTSNNISANRRVRVEIYKGNTKIGIKDTNAASNGSWTASRVEFDGSKYGSLVAKATMTDLGGRSVSATRNFTHTDTRPKFDDVNALHLSGRRVRVFVRLNQYTEPVEEILIRPVDASNNDGVGFSGWRVDVIDRQEYFEFEVPANITTRTLRFEISAQFAPNDEVYTNPVTISGAPNSDFIRNFNHIGGGRCSFELRNTFANAEITIDLEAAIGNGFRSTACNAGDTWTSFTVGGNYPDVERELAPRGPWLRAEGTFEMRLPNGGLFTRALGPWNYENPYPDPGDQFEDGR